MTLNGTLTLNTVIAKTAKRLYAIRYVVEARRSHARGHVQGIHI